MLAEAFIVRLGVAARLQEQRGSLSIVSFNHFNPNKQLSFEDRPPCPPAPGRPAMGNSRNSDWPAVFFLLLLVGTLLTAFTPSPAKGQEPPLQEGCRAVSNLEYDTARREYILISRGGRYVETGRFWRHHYWWCHV